MARYSPNHAVNPALAGLMGRARAALLVGTTASALGTRVDGSTTVATELEPGFAGSLDNKLGERHFDLIVLLDAFKNEGETRKALQSYVARLEDEGRLILTTRGGALRVDVETQVRELGLEVLAVRTVAQEQVVVARKKPRPRPLSLTVGMLTMNEEPSIARMIAEIRQHAPDAKLLCVDSSLKDRTPLIAEELGARVLRQLPPRGHGPAMELLMYEAAKESDALIYLDCDFTYPPEFLPKVRHLLESGVDVVNAARVRERPAAMPLPNYLANKTFALCAELLNGIPVADLHSGMRGYRSSVIRAFDFDGSGDALPIDTLLWPARSGYHVVEVPIDYQERVGVSKLRKLAGTAWTFIRLARTLDVGKRGQGRYDVLSRDDVDI